MVIAALALITVACGADSDDDAPGTGSTDGAAGEEDSTPDGQGEEQEETVILQVVTNDATAPTRVTNFIEAAEALNEELEADGSDVRVQVDTVVRPMSDTEYDQHLIFVNQADEAADIYATGYTRIGWLSDAGYILPMDDLRDEAVFEDLIPGYWDSVTYDGQIWGVVQDTEARSLYFNKAVLRELGWSEDEIASLPDRIEQGDFLIEDLTVIAREAVESGATGHGFLHTSGGGSAKADLAMVYGAFGADYYDTETGEFLLDRAPMVEAMGWLSGLVEAGVTPDFVSDAPKIDLLADLVNGRALFMIAGIWDEAKFKSRGLHDELGNVDEEWISENIGVALMPSAGPDVEISTFSNPWAYVVSSGTEHPELVQRLLAHVSSPELQATHAVESAHIPFTQAGQEQPAVQADAWLNHVSYMINYSRFMPNDPDAPVYGDLVTEMFQSVETGLMAPEQAVDWLAGELDRRLENFRTVQ